MAANFCEHLTKEKETMKKAHGHAGRGMSIGDLLKNGPSFDFLAGMGPCDDENCPICGGGGKGKSSFTTTPKAPSHIFVDAELVGAKAQVEYLQETVSQLLDAKTELTEELKEAKEHGKTDDQVITSLRGQRNELENRVSDLTEEESSQSRVLKENAEKLSKSRGTAQARQTVINKIMAVIGNVPEKKPTKADYLECFAKIQEIVTAPPEAPAQP